MKKKVPLNYSGDKLNKKIRELCPPKKTLKIQPAVMERYNQETCYCVRFETEDGLDELNKRYRDVRGLPKFAHDFLKLRPSRHIEGLIHQSNLYSFNREGDIMIMPNPGCTDHEQLMKTPLLAKENPDGFGAVSWSIHPSQIEETEFNNLLFRTDAEYRALVLKEKTVDIGKDPRTGEALGIKRSTSYSKLLKRTSSQVDIGTLERESSVPYKATILDLTPDDIPMLQRLKEMALENLKTGYGVDPETDTVRNYFHFPYVDETTTLHMHIRVNQGMHRVEESRSFEVNQIIESLEKYGSVKPLIMARGTVYTGSSSKIFVGVEGISVSLCANPFRQTSPIEGDF